MSMYILLLILFSAICHATWNIIAKNTKDKLTLLWLQMIFNAVLLTPIVLIFFKISSIKAIPFLLLSGIFQALYYIVLSKSYECGNIALVYPLTRGSAPIFVCIFSAILGIEKITLPMFISIFLIAFGIYCVNLNSITKEEILTPFKILIKDKSARLSILIGIIIAIYTIIDKQNVKLVEPIVIYYIITIIPMILLAPMLLRKDKIKKELENKGWIRVILVALLTLAAYLLVLFAMSLTNVSFVSSIREISVVFVTFYTAIKMKDSNWKPKFIGACIIFVGIFLLSYFS